jgi:hypothetical protein
MVIFTQKLNTCSTIFSFSVLGYFVTHFPSFTKYSRMGKGGVVLVACYACASDGQWAAFAGKEKLLPFPGEALPPWATLPRPRDFGNHNSSS